MTAAMPSARCRCQTVLYPRAVHRVAVGFGSFSCFGLVEDFNDDWVGRYYILRDSLLGMTVPRSVPDAIRSVAKSIIPVDPFVLVPTH